MLPENFIDNETILLQTDLSVEMCTKSRLQIIGAGATLRGDRVAAKDQFQQGEISRSGLEGVNSDDQDTPGGRRVLVYFVGNGPIS